jgi:hypothetical protein
LEFIGEREFADLTKRANAVVEKARKKTSLEFKEFVDSYSFDDLIFEKFDDEYYKLDERKPLYKTLADFIRKNKKEFIDR